MNTATPDSPQTNAPSQESVPHFFDLDPDELTDLIKSWGMPKFRAKQIIEWVYVHGVIDPEAMTNLSKNDRRTLKDRLCFNTGSILRHQIATDGTQKLLVGWPEDRVEQYAKRNPNPDYSTECVMIPAENSGGSDRRTACISSQIGCPVGCRFCASGISGLDGNLSAGQILEQIWWLNHLTSAWRAAQVDTADSAETSLPAECTTAKRISNIVFMGMGEPLSNIGNVTTAIKRMTADWAFNLSGRKITVSTVGLPAQIRRLADLDIPITLAISLHAPNDDLRRRLIPWAQYTSVDSILEAARDYFDRSGREVTFEYILLNDVNDRPEHAKQLATILRPLRCHVNLIRYNEVKGLAFGRPQGDAVQAFQESLRSMGINATIRASRGRDIAAACGQLRHEANA